MSGSRSYSIPRDGNAKRSGHRSQLFEFFYQLGSQPQMSVFRSGAGIDSQALLAIGAGVFELEKVARNTTIDRAVLPLVGVKISSKTAARISSTLRDLIQYVLMQDVVFELREQTRPPEKPAQQSSNIEPADAVCLFSGGVDSYVGLSTLQKRFRKIVSIFCAHSDQSWTIHLTKALHARYFASPLMRLEQVYVPRITKGGYAQLRGFLYVLSAAAWMHITGASRLYVTEVGPTMYQPRFAPFDSVTMTTHPYVLEAAQSVVEDILGRPISIIKPFEDMTKAEVFAIAPRRQAIPMTHSCISQRFGDHDGTCYGCVVRRLASTAAGVADVTYRRDPLVDPTASRGNLLSLLRFCLEYLSDPEDMPEYAIGDINHFAKRDLFRRFALDNFAAVHRLASMGSRITDDVRELYREVLIELGGPSQLEKRLRELADRRLKQKL